MPVSLNNTQIVFNDATTQTTSGVTAVNVSTGISSTGGKTPTLTNTGVTSVSGAGTVSVSASTGAITITGTGGSGTVTSVATGNGLSGGTITSTGTLIIACPGVNTVGSYYLGSGYNATYSQGANYGSSNNTLSTGTFNGTSISGTWRNMGNTNDFGDGGIGGILGCRVS
jgi:hypothetical protein